MYLFAQWVGRYDPSAGARCVAYADLLSYGVSVTGLIAALAHFYTRTKH
jgi:hypothetical protein